MKKLLSAYAILLIGSGIAHAQAQEAIRAQAERQQVSIIIVQDEHDLKFDFTHTLANVQNEIALVREAVNLTDIAREVVDFVKAHSPLTDTPFSEVPVAPPAAVYSCLALTGLRRKCGPKPGGMKRLYIAPVEYFQDLEYPTYDDAVTGEITDPIPLIATPTPKKFIEIQAAYDTTKWGFASKGKSGNQSFEQNITFDYYGIDKDSVSLVARLLNTPCVIIARGNNNINYFIGSLDVPLEFEINADSGAKGSDPQKITFMAKNDGFMFPVIPLNATATFAVEPLPAAA
ncbi:hypothetical protein [Runella sp.]|uniref:hypothetical protein n=1 Tax=Runella sp. TaxID=1960881 RepID=UPI003D101937